MTRTQLLFFFSCEGIIDWQRLLVDLNNNILFFSIA